MPWVNGMWQPENDSVVPRVNAIVAQDSPLMQRAQGIGVMTANRRGLSNSSMAAGEAAKAVIDQAIPLASQDAQQTYGKNTTSMGVGAQDRANLTNAQIGASANYASQVAGINANDKLDAATRGAGYQSAADLRQADLDRIAAIYGGIPGITWNGAGNPAAGPTVAAPTTPPGYLPPVAAVAPAKPKADIGTTLGKAVFGLGGLLFG